ncbi:hypothetical protein [Streptomyces sp. NPDC090022]|uniref:hypothetical protein n=1 Tax=Streptomyces sp. NPDC090022 TaxID=3365920 RepID=UPI0038010A79
MIQFEPAANEVVLAPGDRITIEWPDWNGRTPGTFLHRPDRLIIGEPGVTSGWTRVWNSAGEEITY